MISGPESGPDDGATNCPSGVTVPAPETIVNVTGTGPSPRTATKSMDPPAGTIAGSGSTRNGWTAITTPEQVEVPVRQARTVACVIASTVGATYRSPSNVPTSASRETGQLCALPRNTTVRFVFSPGARSVRSACNRSAGVCVKKAGSEATRPVSELNGMLTRSGPLTTPAGT